MRCPFLLLTISSCFAQNYLPHDLSVGFRYENSLGQSSYSLGDSGFGYGLKYAYRPTRWLALEIGLEQVPRTVGSAVCCEYSNNALDELFLAPFGARYFWEPDGGRIRLSIGGGGAYLNHTIGDERSFLTPESGWGAQFVAGGDYTLSRSGRFRAGITVRYYYVGVGRERTARVLTVGPDFTWSFR